MKSTTEKSTKKNLPVQAAPVQRVLHTTAPSVAGQEGVEANFWGAAISTLAPVAVDLISRAIRK